MLRITAVLSLLVACSSPPPPTPIPSPSSVLRSPLPSPTVLPAGVLVVENEGQVCFRTCDNCGEMEASVVPKGCFSSSCDLVLDQSGGVEVDRTAKALRFRARFVILDISHSGTVQTCSADCNNRFVSFYDHNIEFGTWSVWLGETKLGDVTVTFRGPTNQISVCVGDNY